MKQCLLAGAGGGLQCYFKDLVPILCRTMGYRGFGGYASLWYRLLKAHDAWLIPILTLLLPFSWGGAWLIAVLWALFGLMPPWLVMGLKVDPNVGAVRCSPGDLLRMHLLGLFQAWAHFYGFLLFVFCSRRLGRRLQRLP